MVRCVSLSKCHWWLHIAHHSHIAHDAHMADDVVVCPRLARGQRLWLGSSVDVIVSQFLSLSHFSMLRKNGRKKNQTPPNYRTKLSIFVISSRTSSEHKVYVFSRQKICFHFKSRPIKLHTHTQNSNAKTHHGVSFTFAQPANSGQYVTVSPGNWCTVPGHRCRERRRRRRHGARSCGLFALVCVWLG